MEKASLFSTLPLATSMRRRCGRLRCRRVDNALLIHRYGPPANTTLKDEPPCPATAAPKCRAPRISRSTCSTVAATCWSAISTSFAKRCEPHTHGIPSISMPGSSYLITCIASGRYLTEMLTSPCPGKSSSSLLPAKDRDPDDISALPRRARDLATALLGTPDSG